MKKIKSVFKTEGTVNGAYRVGLTVLVIGIVVLINLIFGMLPERYRKIDVSSTKIYDISDTTEEFLDELQHDVSFTILAQKEDTDDRIKTIVDKYAGLSDKISVKWVDPVLHPSAAAQYDASENMIVVECEDTGRTTLISFSDIIVFDTSSYFYTGQVQESEFDGEGQLTAAVNYVSTDISKNIYYMTGHGEQAFSGTMTSLIEKNNYRTDELNLMMDTQIPENCDLLVIYAPAKDIENIELENIRKYLKDGGDVMILLGDISSLEMPNIASLMEEYGMTEESGYLADPARCYQGNPYVIFPELSVQGKMADKIVSEMVLLADVKGMNIVTPARDTISTSEFMTSSDQAVVVSENEQKPGQYALGAVAVESTAEGEESKITVISAGSMIDPGITDGFTGLENTTLFMNVLNSHFDDVKNISVEPKSLLVEYNAVRYPGIFSLLVIFGIPAVVLVSGFIVWYKRRKA